MKVFFNKPKSSPTGKLLAAASVLLAFALLVSQWRIFSNKETVRVSAKPDALSAVLESVTLTSSRSLGKGEAYIYLNGEEYAPFLGTDEMVSVYANAVVEVLSCTDSKFEIGYEASGINVTSIAPSEKILCKKGINFICRFVSK